MVSGWVMVGDQWWPQVARGLFLRTALPSERTDFGQKFGKQRSLGAKLLIGSVGPSPHLFSYDKFKIHRTRALPELHPLTVELRHDLM